MAASNSPHQGHSSSNSLLRLDLKSESSLSSTRAPPIFGLAKRWAELVTAKMATEEQPTLSFRDLRVASLRLCPSFYTVYWWKQQVLHFTGGLLLSSAGMFLLNLILKGAVFFSLLSQTTFSFLHLEMFDSSSAER